MEAVEELTGDSADNGSIDYATAKCDSAGNEIWDLGAGTVIYDNQISAGDSSDAASVLSGGSIAIH